MAEAVVAFGVAANVLSFVEFGSKLASNLWKVYHGYQEGLSWNFDLALQTNSLRQLMNDLTVDESNQDQLGGEFNTLAEACKNVASELLDLLGSISDVQTGKKSSAIKAALRSVWKEEDISHLEKRLSSFRLELMLHLISSLRTQVRRSEKQQSIILQKIDEVSVSSQGTKVDTDEIGSRVIEMIVSKLPIGDRLNEMREIERFAVDNVLSNGNADDLTVSPSQVQRFTRVMLAHLHYSTSQDRARNIIDAHRKTFNWVLDDEEHGWTNLASWLASDSKLYWITGKAGSGKSTLMKFIAYGDGDHARCRPHLARWARGPLKLIVVQHFFWNSGAALQMNQIGLLRSLLHQILSKEPSLIPKTSPARWEALCLFGTNHSRDWTLTELIAMLDAAVAHLDGNVRICFFIDGLDEFDGDHLILVNLCKRLSEYATVKVCVASRPWNIFEQAFNQRPSLRMEDLTRNDITSFVTAELTASVDFADLAQKEPEFSSQLIDNIVGKASGVFLWVHLVTRSLIAGMRYGDRVVDLQHRLDHLPPELEQLYDKMLDSLDPFYFEHAAQLFTMVQVYADTQAGENYPMSLALLSLMDEETSDSIIRLAPASLPTARLELKYEGMQRRINSRTKGLLEVARRPESGLAARHVQYLHRTVRDYLMSPACQQRVRDSLKPSFDAHLQICVGIFAAFKLSVGEQLYSLPVPVCDFLESAHHVHQTYDNDVVRLFEDLVATIPYFDITNSKYTVDYQLYFLPDQNLAELLSEDVTSSAMCRSAAYFKVYSYLRLRAPDGYLIARDGTTGARHHSLVADALGIVSVDLGVRQRSWAIPDLEMLAMMLQNGAHVSPLYPIEVTMEDHAADPLTYLLTSMNVTSGTRFSFASSQPWKDALQLLVTYHDRFWPIEYLSSWSFDQREEYRLLLHRSFRSFASQDQKLSLSQQLRLRYSPSRHVQLVHQTRVKLLRVMRDWMAIT